MPVRAVEDKPGEITLRWCVYRSSNRVGSSGWRRIKNIKATSYSNNSISEWWVWLSLCYWVHVREGESVNVVCGFVLMRLQLPARASYPVLQRGFHPSQSQRRACRSTTTQPLFFPTLTFRKFMNPGKLGHDKRRERFLFVVEIWYTNFHKH